MRRFIILLPFLIALASCKQAKNSTLEKEKMSEQSLDTSPDKKIQEVIDSILSFKPMKLNISEERSDVDALIPLGHNNHGSFAFIKDENSGASSAVNFYILPAYQDFKLESQFEVDEPIDSVIPKNKEFIYYALKKAGIQLGNTIDKISQDSLEKKYKVRFDVKKTYGAANTDYGSNQKTLSSVLINCYHGISEFPFQIVNENFPVSHGVYDVSISDYLVIPGEEGVFGFVVLVTESIGFEGYRRKSFEVIQVGAVSGN